MSQWVRKRFSSEGNVFCNMPAVGVIYAPALQVETRLVGLGPAAPHQSEAASASGGVFTQTVGSLTGRRARFHSPPRPRKCTLCVSKAHSAPSSLLQTFFRLTQHFHQGSEPASSHLTSGELDAFLRKPLGSLSLASWASSPDLGAEVRPGGRVSSEGGQQLPGSVRQGQ